MKPSFIGYGWKRHIRKGIAWRAAKAAGLGFVVVYPNADRRHFFCGPVDALPSFADLTTVSDSVAFDDFCLDPERYVRAEERSR